MPCCVHYRAPLPAADPWAPKLPALGWPQPAVAATISWRPASSRARQCAAEPGRRAKLKPAQATRGTRPSAKSPHQKNTTHKHVLLARSDCPPRPSSVPSSLRIVRVPERHNGLAQAAFAPAPGHRDAPQAAQRLARARVQPPLGLTGCPHTTLNRKSVQYVRHTPNNDD